MTAAVPNILTALRLLAVPILVWLILRDDGADGALRWWALGTFLAASATDLLDGYLARRWQVVTAMGKIADPIADKALVLAGLAALSVVDDIPWWPVIVIAAREVIVTIGRLWVVRTTVIAASSAGKTKTALQVAAVTFYLLPLNAAWIATVAWVLLVAAVVVAVISGWRYMVAVVRASRAASGGARGDGG